MIKNNYSCTTNSKHFLLAILMVLFVGAANAQVAPVAGDDFFAVFEDTQLDDSVSANDSDADGPSANYTLVNGTANGMLFLNTDGTFSYLPVLNFNGTDSFVYSLCDGGTPDLCDTATVVITVDAVNDTPTISQIGGTLPEDAAATFCPLIADVDSNQVLTVSICGGPANGTAIADTNCVTYTANSNFNGNDTICLLVCDNGTPVLCDTVVVAFAVAAVNDAPVAGDDVNTGNEDTDISGDVIGNDGDGPALTYTADIAPAYGTVIVNGNGTYTYSPAANFNGVDSFTYSVCDGGTPEQCDTATVVITVTAVNDAPTISQVGGTLPEESTVTFCPLITDIDSNQVLAVSICGGPANGIAVADTNCITYSANPNFNGADGICLLVCDNGTPVLCDTVVVPIVISAVNDAPVAADDNIAAPQGVPYNDDVTGNDSDVDGPTADYTLVTDVANGTLVLNTDGSFTYTPNTGYAGTDTFVYSLCDGGTPNLCDTAMVVITVSAANAAPVANGDNFTANEDMPLNDAVTGNDSDADGPLANYTVVTTSLNGALTLNGDGTFTYAPAANFAGADSFTYSLCDGGTPELCDTATAVITVAAVNDAPVANDDAFTTTPGTTLNENAATNDTDIDGPAVDYTLVTEAANGTLVLNTDGSFTYTPNTGYVGADTFVYSLCDGGTPDNCDTAIVIINTVSQNNAPVANNDNFATNEDETLNNTVSTNDTDADGPTANYTTATTTVNGALVLNTDGTFSYAPNAEFAGVDSFVYSLCDGGVPVLCDTATVVITINIVNDAPVAANDNNTTAEDAAVNGDVSGNDSDIDGPGATYTVATNPANGTVTVNADGTYTYTPNADFNGFDSFTYSLCDGGTPEQCDTATVLVSITAVNDAPVADDDAITINEDNVANGDVSANDNDVDGPGATYTIAGNPSNGTLVLGTDGAFIYTPNADFAGCDSALISVCDGGTPNLCDTSLLIVCVTAVNDAPNAVNDNNTTVEDAPVNGDVSTNDTDPDGPDATYTIATNPTNGTLVLGTDGDYIYAPNAGFSGCDTAAISVCDGGIPNLCDTSLLVICVAAANLPPVAQNDSLTSQEDATLLINVLANDADPEGGLGNPTILNQPAHGTVTVNGDGTLTYVPEANFNGTDSFSYIVCDGGTPPLCDTATVVLTITPVDDIPEVTAQPLVTDEDVTGSTCFDYILDNLQDSVTVTIVCSPANGTVDSVTAGNGQICVVYTPGQEFNGEDSVCVQLCDLAGGGCITVTVPITVNAKEDACLWLKGISPNGDGQNDSFYINCNSDFPSSTLRIFNRWGDEVYRSEGHYNNDWYGRNQTGKDLPDGTYFYIFDYGDGVHKAHAGFITVNR
ncbi:MAG TPA: Ig-like domain-containing protein [Chitinophagales bacterium]|nr:Ig-like domain-containing protein [Chitinophagales bacterium]